MYPMKLKKLAERKLLDSMFYAVFVILSASFLQLTLAPKAQAQVRLIQWSDAHSSLDTIVKQMVAIDSLGKDFLVQNPKGEVVIYVLGDFTSINSYSQQDGGWLSFEALKILKDLGYTVIFTPGNHDAFDWSGKIDGAELFLQQMAQLHEWGIPILAANIHKPTKPFKKYLSPSYPLETLKKSTHIVGMTLDILLKKSNLSELRAPRLFERIESYEKTLPDALKKLRKSHDIEQVILGVHQGHKRLGSLAKDRVDLNAPEVVHFLGADDHLVTAYEKKGALVTDAGAYGSFSVIDYRRSGKVVTPVLHVAINQDSFSEINPEVFNGVAQLNSMRAVQGKTDPRILAYRTIVNKHLAKIRRSWNKPIVVTQGFESHKMQMKKSRTTLGSILAQTLEIWTRQKLDYQAATRNLVAQPEIGPVIVAVNSSSYRREISIPAGPLTELEVRDTYPYLNEATLYRLPGKLIAEMIHAIRETYSEGDPDRYTPQMNFNVRDNNGVLEVYHGGQWSRIKNNHMYPFALDGWLSTHRFGQGFQDPLWIKVLSENIPVAFEVYQDVLVKNIAAAVKEHEGLQCFRFLQHGFTN